MSGHANVVEAQLRMWDNDEWEDAEDDDQEADDPEGDSA